MVGDLPPNYLTEKSKAGALVFGQHVKNVKTVKRCNLWEKSNRLTLMQMCDLLLTEKRAPKRCDAFQRETYRLA